MIKADLTIGEVIAPINHWCDSGHIAPDLYRRSGPDSELEPTRFFKVSTDGKTYCEPCLTVANHISKLQKEGKI